MPASIYTLLNEIISIFDAESLIRYGGLLIIFLVIFGSTGLFFCFLLACRRVEISHRGVFEALLLLGFENGLEAAQGPVLQGANGPLVLVHHLGDFAVLIAFDKLQCYHFKYTGRKYNCGWGYGY